MATLHELTDSEATRVMRTDERVENVAFPDRFKWTRKTTTGRSFLGSKLGSIQIVGPLLGRARFERCTFDQVDFTGASIRGADFLGCRFSNLTFGPRLLGLVEQVTFEQCRFERAILAEIQLKASTISKTVFEGLDASRLRCSECVLDEVRMAGRLVTCNFVNTAFRAVDLSDAELVELSVVDAVEFDVQLPKSRKNFCVPPTAFAEVLPDVRDQLGPASRQRFSRAAERFASGRGRIPIESVSAAQFVEYSEPEIESIMSALYEKSVGRVRSSVGLKDKD